MSGVTQQEPTAEEVKALPYNFENLVVYVNDDLTTHRTLYTTWNEQDVRKLPNQQWQFEHSTDDITADDWEKHYPSRVHITVTSYHYLEGTYDDKYIHWSKSQARWVYRNNKPVEFKVRTPTPEAITPEDEDSGGEEAVTAILERTEHTLVAATSALSSLTPERTPTPLAVPGTLPVTPVASTSWGSFLPTPTSGRQPRKNRNLYQVHPLPVLPYPVEPPPLEWCNPPLLEDKWLTPHQSPAGHTQKHLQEMQRTQKTSGQP
jgi:hypothetical protein